MTTILALDASEWQGRLSKQHMQFAYDMGVRMYIVQLWGSGPTGNGPNDYAKIQLGYAKDVGMMLAGYMWVPPDNTIETSVLVDVALSAAGSYINELLFVAPDLEGGKLHPTNPVGRLMNVCQHLTLANKKIVIYCRKNNWPTVMGGPALEFGTFPLWEARYYLKSGYKPATPPDIDWAWTQFGGWKERAILQYAGTAPVNGWSADWNVVDLDRVGIAIPTSPTPPTPPTPPVPAPVPTPVPVPAPEEETLSSKEYETLVKKINDLRTWTQTKVHDAIVNRLAALEKKVDAIKSAPAPAPTPTPAPTPKMREYVVQAGDSLSLIAKKFYGNAGLFNRIAAHNYDRYPSLRSNVNHIEIGWVLRIPPTP